MTDIPFIQEHKFEYGKIEQMSPNIRRITARNPSMFSFHGTGTYIVGKGKVAVIDPGPLLDEHIATLKQALAGEEVTHILITHTHNDHSPAAAPLKSHWHCPTYGFGPHGAGQIDGKIIDDVNSDMAYSPDVTMHHGDVIEGSGWTIECVHTPGHTSNHMCFAFMEEKALFTGDHVMAWSTAVIGPPDGNMTQYMESLNHLLERDDKVYWPTHGTCIRDTKNFVNSYINHRLAREKQILKCLQQGITVITDMVPVMYQSTDKKLYGAAALSVLAAMERLVSTGTVICNSEVMDTHCQYGLR